MTTTRSKLRAQPEGRQAGWKGLFLSAAAAMRPKPTLSVPDWADQYRVLSASVGAVGGPWQTSRVEVARGPMMAVTEPGVRTITAMTCTQTLKTELLTNTFGYYAHLDPSPILLLEPKDEMAEAFSKERLTPMINSSPVLRELMSGSADDIVTSTTRGKKRRGEDTIKYKKFPGGFLAISSAGSPSNLAMRAIRIVLEDEIDKYETSKEGDPITLAEERMATFTYSKLAIRACSPTWEETSRIYKSYLDSDQRRPYCACPKCGHWQTLDFFKHVHWDKSDEGKTHHPETAAIYCEACGSDWSEADRVNIVTTKHAIRHYQTREFNCCDERQEPMKEQLWDWDDKYQVGYAKCKHCGKHAVSNDHAGFQVSKLYSPFITVVELARKWVMSKDDPETKQTFYNTQLGLPFRAEVSKEVDQHWLASRREQYPAVVPEGVVVITAGIDVQSGGKVNEGRIEVEVVGWGLGEESWSLKTEVFYGNPAQPEVWKQVDEFLLKPWRHERGFDLYIAGACIDSGGNNTQDVYRFARARVGRNIWAIKGASDKSGQWSPLWPPQQREEKHQKFRQGWRPVIIGVNAGKEAIRQRLLIEEVGPGYCHFPIDRPQGWFEQITAEDLVLEKKMGVSIRVWKLRKGRANEALDTRVYAYAALQGLMHTRMLDLAVQAARIAAMVAPERDEDGGDRPATDDTPRRQVRQSEWMNGR